MKLTRAFLVLCFLSAFMGIAGSVDTFAKADGYFSYACQPGGQGTLVDINVIIDVNAQFCDGPTQWNVSHPHCATGGAALNLGGFTVPGTNGGSLGGLLGRGTGGGGGICQYQCPDGTPAPQPNPAFYGSSAPYIDIRKVIKAHRAFCVVQHHLKSAGPTSEIVRPEEGDPDLYVPGPSLQSLIDANIAEGLAQNPAPPPSVELKGATQ